MAAARSKKNGSAEHAAIARSFGEWLLSKAPRPNVQLVGTALPSLAGVDGILSKSIALLIRTLIIHVDEIENETKRHSAGGCLMSLADLLEALEIPNQDPWWNRR